MRKRKLKRALREVEQELAAANSAADDWEDRFHARDKAPVPAEIELLIAARLELAEIKFAEGCRRNVNTARVQTLAYVREALKLRLLQPGTQQYWAEFSDWLDAYKP